ncbi:MAG TPA: hypothetical protein VL946_08400 [Lacibacter sp.]|nr:hypothetical protein [Lacibacter sp.]
MYQLSSTGASANFRNENERENLNSKIEIFQQNHGECSSFKELVEKLLEVANSQELPIEPITVIPPNYVKIGENIEEVELFMKKIGDFHTHARIPAQTLTIKETIEKALEAAQTPLPLPQKIEVPAELPENAIILEFTDEPNRPFSRKMEILLSVQANRQRKYNLPFPESFPAIVEKLVFSEGALFNHGGDFYTGF